MYERGAFILPLHACLACMLSLRDFWPTLLAKITLRKFEGCISVKVSRWSERAPTNSAPIEAPILRVNL